MIDHRIFVNLTLLNFCLFIFVFTFTILIDSCTLGTSTELSLCLKVKYKNYQLSSVNTPLHFTNYHSNINQHTINGHEITCNYFLSWTNSGVVHYTIMPTFAWYLNGLSRKLNNKHSKETNNNEHTKNTQTWPR